MTKTEYALNGIAGEIAGIYRLARDANKFGDVFVLQLLHKALQDCMSEVQFRASNESTTIWGKEETPWRDYEAVRSRLE